MQLILCADDLALYYTTGKSIHLQLVINTEIIGLIVVCSSLFGLPVFAGFGRCDLSVFYCESVNSLNMKTESMLLFIDLNVHQNLSK